MKTQRGMLLLVLLSIAAMPVAGACVDQAAAVGAGLTTVSTEPVPTPRIKEELPPAGTQQPFETGPYTSERFWLGVVPGGTNVEHYESLDEMAKASDAVVLGHILGIAQDPRRHTSLDPKNGAFAQLTFAIDKVVGGEVHSAEAGTVVVEIYFLDVREYDRFASRLPTEAVLLFLRNKAVEAEAFGWEPDGTDAGTNYYRVVSDQGLIWDRSGAAQPAEIDGEFIEDLEGTPFDRLIADSTAAAARQ